MKKVEIYDNFLSPEACHTMYDMTIHSEYKLGWEDSYEIQNRSYPNLHGRWSLEDLKKTTIVPPLLKILKKRNIKLNNFFKCIINLTKPHDVNFIHIHHNQIGVLYYSNITWDPQWGGETLFYEDNKKDILLASPYVPNRLIVFDGSVPHTIKSQNLVGPSYRFTTSIFFHKNEDK